LKKDILKNGYIDINNGQIHYSHIGEGDVALFLFHESPQSAKVYANVMPYLADNFSVYAFDTPGYGNSTPPKKPLKIEEYASILVEGIDKLDIKKYATGGCHTGASLALEIINLKGQDDAVFCVLNGVPYFSSEERQEYMNNWSPDIEISENGEHLIWAWQRYKRIYGHEASKELVNFGAVGILECLEKYNWAYNAAFEYVPDSLLKNLDVPILFLNSKKDLLTHCDIEADKITKNSTLSLQSDHPGQLHMREPKIYSSEIIKFYNSLS
jgi:pimeloyl-ACP methyl ester carboxylesterase